MKTPSRPDRTFRFTTGIPRPSSMPTGELERILNHIERYEAACERLGDLVAEIAGEHSEVAELLAEIRMIESERERQFDDMVNAGDAR